MNWYKKILLSMKMMNKREFLQRLNRFGVIINKSTNGWVFTNPTNGAVADLHRGNKHTDLNRGVMSRILRDLGIDHIDFERGKVPQRVEQTKEEEEKSETPAWQQQKWFLDQQRKYPPPAVASVQNNINKKATRARYPGQEQGDERRPGGAALYERYQDNDLVEGEFEKKMRKLIKEQRWDEIETYAEEMREMGFNQARIDSIVSRAGVGVRF